MGGKKWYIWYDVGDISWISTDNMTYTEAKKELKRLKKGERYSVCKIGFDDDGHNASIKH